MLEFINIYLPFKKPEKELTFDREIESIIDKEKNMGAPTIRDLYDRKIREDERKMARKELLKMQRAAKATQEKLEKAAKATQEKLEKAAKATQEKLEKAAKATQEKLEAERLSRQEEARLHQDKLKAVVLNLHNQGISAKAIADMLLEPIALVKKIINN
jgi:hypothetical protein